MLNKREAHKAQVSKYAKSKLMDAYKVVRDFGLDYGDQEMKDEASRLLHQLNRIRNIEMGRRFWTNDGLDETSRKDLYQVPYEQDVIGGMAACRYPDPKCP